MRYIGFIVIAISFIACSKATQDTYTFKCTTTWQPTPFSTASKDTTLYNYSDNQANNYVRITSVNGRTTICMKQ